MDALTPQPRRRQWGLRRLRPSPAVPGAELGRLPLGLDLRAVNVAEGVRAAVAVASIVLLGEWLDVPALAEAALGALLTCLCDSGGPARRRIVALACFTVLGALFTAGFGLLRTAGLPVVVPAACLAILCLGLARIWGQAAMQLGNLLTVVLVLALDRALDPRHAVELALCFAGGSLWALGLTMLVWRLHPFGPARRALSDALRRLLDLSHDLAELLSAGVHDPAAWDAHARAHRRAARDAIEQARGVVLDTVRQRGAVRHRSDQLLIQAEALDHLFGALIALSDVLEFADDGARKDGARLLRALNLALAALVDDTLHPEPAAGDAARRAMLERFIGIIDAASAPALRDVAHAVADRLRVAARLSAPDGLLPDAADAPGGWRQLVLAPLRANLSWQSAPFRHALRAAAVAAPALLLTLPAIGPGHGDAPGGGHAPHAYAHWLTITLVLTMQPFFAATWQKALERIGGTVLGGLVAAALGLVLHSPLVTAAALFPLAVVAFAVRPVSFGLFQACLTPLVVLLSELGQPGESGLVIAGLRALYTVAGGLLAVAGTALLWPSWEPDRLDKELRAALDAHAAYADAVLAGSDDADAARQEAGRASNNLEASIARALQEPRRHVRAGLEPVVMVDAALRRMAGRLSLLHLARDTGQAEPDPAWRAWLASAWPALLQGARLPPRPAAPADDALTRVAQQIELIAGALGRMRRDAPDPGQPDGTRAGQGA